MAPGAKSGELWTGGMTTDRGMWLDPKTGFQDRISRPDFETGQGIEYPLAQDTNIRHIFVDNTTRPVTGRQQPPGFDRRGRAAGLIGQSPPARPCMAALVCF
jgi:hypothetical protein